MQNLKDKPKAILRACLQYIVFAFLLLSSLELATNSIIAGLILAASAFLTLPVIRKKFIPNNLRHPLLTTILIIAACIVSMNISDNAAQAEREKKRQEIEVSTKQAKEKSVAAFLENPQPKIDEIKSLIEQDVYGIARNQINYYKETENEELKTLDVQLSKIEEKQEEDRKKRQQERLAKQAEELAKQGEEKAAALWSYSQNDDPMSNGKTYYASISSSNTVQFDFPYSGAQQGTLTLRTHPKHGKDVIFSIERGQILCPSYDSCTVRVRFDEEDATLYSASGAADNSTETIFIRNYSAFVGKMMKAKRVRLSMNIYQEGAPVFDFDVSGFNVDKYKPRN